MPEKLTLHVCHFNDRGTPLHPCKRAHKALRAAGHDYETVIAAHGRFFGLFTKGRRPDLKALSGQEKLPVLELTDGATVSGSARIVAWAKANAP